VKHASNDGRGAVVVDRRPLERNLVRFILQENGFDVLAEASTPAEAIRAVEQHRPSVVVLHENAAWERGERSIPMLRDASPSTKVLLIAPAFGVVRIELLRDADAVIEEGVGFKDLPFVVGRLSSGEAARASAALVAQGVLAPPPAPRRPDRRDRWTNRLQGATAAAAVFLALVLARSAVVPPPVAGPAAGAALASAQHTLAVLTAQVTDPNSSENAILTRASELAAERARAIAAGADVSELDREIASLLQDVFPTVSPATRTAIVDLFGGIPGVTPTPSPTPSASPEPTETPTPSPPVELSPSPAPSETETPPPTESPSPTETET
jgi:hypothetical protein